MLELLLTSTNQRKTSSFMKKIHENEINVEKGDEKKNKIV